MMQLYEPSGTDYTKTPKMAYTHWKTIRDIGKRSHWIEEAGKGELAGRSRRGHFDPKSNSGGRTKLVFTCRWRCYLRNQI